MNTTEINKRENGGVISVQWPLRDEDIETVRKALEERKRVRWKQAWGTSDVSEEDLNRQTSQTIRILLRRGIDINTPGIYWIDLSNPSKYDHDACLPAARRGDRIMNYDGTDYTGSILATDTDINETGREGMTLLHRAAAEGDTPRVRELLDAGADPHAFSEIFSDDGPCTALHLAAREGHTDTVLALLEVDHRPDIGSAEYGWSPLHVAASTVSS